MPEPNQDEQAATASEAEDANFGENSAPSADEPVRGRRSRQAASELPDTSIDPWDFDENVNVFAATDGMPVAVETDDGTLISWEAVQNVSDQVFYVVAASDQESVQLLHRAERLAATTQRSVEVSKSAGPYFGIFAFEGKDLESAKQATGVPHGVVTLLREVRDVTAQTLSSVVVLRWRKPKDVASVAVMRSRPNEPLPEHFQPGYLIPCSDPNMLQDESVAPGARYTYRIYSISGSGHRSVGVTQTVIVPEQPIAVTDLRAEVAAIREGDPWVHLTYTEPRSGRVTIFESATRPRPVSDDQLFEAAETERLGLGSAMSSYPIRTDDGRMLLNGMYSTAQGLSRYYTPVTAGDQRYRVGRTAVVHHVGPARDPEVLDRVSWQLLRFRWPQGAESVIYRVGALGAKDAAAAGQELAVSRATYNRDGGIKLDLLSDRGATLFVRGKFFDGRDHFGEWVAINYPGRVKLAYQFAAGEGNTVSLQVWSERPLNRLQAVLHSHPSRWLRNVDHNPPGTVVVAQIDWPHPVSPGVWITVLDALVLPPGRARAFFYVPELPAGETLMALDPLPMPERIRRLGLANAAGAVRNLVGRARSRGSQQVEVGPSEAECPTCFGSYAEDQVWLRCTSNGECGSEPDYARAQLTRELPVPMGRPVHPVPAAQAVGGRTPCPACGNPETVVVCPTCHAELPPHWSSDRTSLYFTFVGATTAGKTTFLAVLLEQLHTVMQPLGRMFQPLNYSSQRRQAGYRSRLFEEGQTEDGTRPVSENLELLEPLVFDAGPNPDGQPAALVLYDVAGEDMKTAADTGRYGHLLDNSDCLIFLIDLLQIDAVREQVRGLSDGLAELPVKVSPDPAQVLMNVANAIRLRRGYSSGPVEVRAAIALAKFDVFQLGMRNRNGNLARFVSPGSVLMQDPYADPRTPGGPGGLFFPADSQQVHVEARDLLEQLGAKDFLNTLEANFSDFRFFAVSALGHSPLNGINIADSGISTFRLADMVRWAMSEHWYG
ncbi:MAG: hypothetical protein M3Y42_04670 [Actinomycetota bacterium]|nr:hypothetical protein [Actinomycetota bacterium]MDQ2956240.1 hypothetical protein [Actinomycetota bacterium]